MYATFSINIIMFLSCVFLFLLALAIKNIKIKDSIFVHEIYKVCLSGSWCCFIWALTSNNIYLLSIPCLIALGVISYIPLFVTSAYVVYFLYIKREK